MVQQVSTNTFGVARWIVSPNPSQGTHTTIAAAIASASSGDTIWVRDGVYTENFTIKPGVNLAASQGSYETPTVNIIGTLTMSGAGTCTVTGIAFQTNSAPCIVVSGASVCNLILEDIYLGCTNNAGISFTNSSSSSSIYITTLDSNIGTTEISLYSMSSSGSMYFYNSNVTNTGNTVTPASNSAGSVFWNTSNVFIPLSTSGTGAIIAYQNQIQTSAQGTIETLTIDGSGQTYISGGLIDGGSEAAMTIGTSGYVQITNVSIGSLAANAFTGLGSITYGGIVFYRASNTISVTTQNPIYLSPFRSTLQPSFSVNITTSPTNVTGDGTDYQIIFDHVNFDQTSSYDAGTGIFTAPIGGKYQLNAACFIDNTSTPMSSFQIEIITTGFTFRNKVGCSTTATPPSGTSINISTIAILSAGETAYVGVSVGGGTKTCGVLGSGVGTLYDTYFNGSLLC